MTGPSGSGWPGAPRPGGPSGPLPNLAPPPPVSRWAPGRAGPPAYGRPPRGRGALGPVAVAVGFFVVVGLVVLVVFIAGAGRSGTDSLRTALPKTQELSALESVWSVQWAQDRDEQLPPGELNDGCLPAVDDADDGYVRSWKASFETGEGGDLTARLLHYPTAADAQDQVTLRNTAGYKTCSEELEGDRRASSSAEGAVDNPGRRRTSYVRTPTGDGIRWSTEDPGLPGCTEYRDHWAVQLGTDVLLVDFHTCSNRFDPRAEQRVVDAVATRHG